MVIYYFSATGNSLKAAVDIASAHEGTTLIPITPKTEPIQHPESVKVGFIFPVYMGTLPERVKKFLLSFPFRCGNYYFAIATYYTYKGVAIPAVEQIMRKKGVQLNYGAHISTVGNCLMKYEVSLSVREKKLEGAANQTKIILDDLSKERRHTPCRSLSVLTRLHESLFRYFFKDVHTRFSVEPTCTGCGKCQRICPSGNITLPENKPSWGKQCLACHACVHWCPQNAIHLGNSKGRLLYHHPDISYRELL